MWRACRCISDNTNAIKYAKLVAKLSLNLSTMYFHENNFAPAKNLSQKALLISKEIGDKNGEASSHLILGEVYISVGEYENAREHLEKSLFIQRETGDRKGEASSYGNLGNVYRSVGEYGKAREHLEISLAIQREIGDRRGEASSYGNLGNVYRLVGKYEKAREHYEKSLVIQREIGDRDGEASSCGNLGNVYQSVDEYEKAREHFEKSLAIQKEIGDRSGEASSYINLGNVYQSVGEYEMAGKHYEKSLAMEREIGDRKGEALSCGNLGNVYLSVGEYEKAREHLEKSLAIQREIGDRSGEASSYINLGNVYRLVGEYEKAKRHYEKSLAMTREIGEREGEASSYMNLGNVYISVGEYEKARKHLEKSLAIQNEIGHRSGEACSYTNLGILYDSVGEYNKALNCFEKSLEIDRDIETKTGVAVSCANLGREFLFLGKYHKANEYNQKALVIFTDIGDREGAAGVCLNQGAVEKAVGNLIKAKKYFEKALALNKEMGNQELETRINITIGDFCFSQSDYDGTEEFIKKALAVSEKIGDNVTQLESFIEMAKLRTRQGKIQEAIWYLHSGIEKCEEMRGSLHDNDQFKISFLDHQAWCYRNLGNLLCQTGKPVEALHVSELLKARVLADLISARYSLEKQISADPRACTGLEEILANVCNCTCLYVSYYYDQIFLWIIKASRVADFQVITGNDLLAREGSSQHLGKFFDFRSFALSSDEIWADQSFHGFLPEWKTWDKDSHGDWRIGEESKSNQGPKMNLPICYKLIIAPVADLLEGPEIIIVPDRALYQIPYAALIDESGKYLSETFRIRVAPSLTTLKLINEIPADYHCQTGALIVGNPDVGEVHFKGKLTTISRLQCAENEARMVGIKLGVKPLLGRQATKEAVLQAMSSVALIHIAAHGDADRGEIVLAPSPAFRIKFPNGIPQEGLYLLTMNDISKVQVRAKLVVLSCCHSARGQTKAEGPVGLARAFLGSGARSVLVALWALDDKSTEHLMTHFYDHLFAGESAGESLHEAMKWMRSEGYDVNQWAPFILIGDDVTFDFGKKGRIQ